MKSRLLVLLLMLVVVTLTSGRGLQADSTEIWNTGHVTTISHNNFPQIKGNCLVWQARAGLGEATSGSGDWEIFYIDIDKQVVIQLTDDDYDDILPQTDGDYVVWQKHDTSRGNQIFLYKIHGENPPGGSMISNDDNKDNYSPRIAEGRVVWTSQRVAHSFEPGEIMLYDAKNLSGPYSISDNTLDCTCPRINSETVIWVQSNGSGATTLFMYDLTSQNPGPEPAPEDYVWPESPQTDGRLTVLTRHDGSDREIFVYNNCSRSYEQVTFNDLEDSYPCISGDKITWVSGKGEDSEIFIADICDDRPITGTVSPSIDILWPPNHDMIPVTIDASALVTHNPDTKISIDSVAIAEYSGEEARQHYGENIYDGNDFEPDWEITGDLTLNLRCETSRASTGRTYTITVTASDCSGDYSFSAEVVCPTIKEHKLPLGKRTWYHRFSYR
jgi:hypothetical protein